MSKRKANVVLEETSPSKRQTRSSGPLVDAQPESPSGRRTTRHSTDITIKALLNTPRKTADLDKVHHTVLRRNSFKENEEASEDDDELNLSPRRRQGEPSTPSRKSTRLFMHSVEIKTPRYLQKIIASASPAPISVKHGGNNSAYRTPPSSPSKTPHARPTTPRPASLSSPSKTRTPITSRTSSDLLSRILPPLPSHNRAHITRTPSQSPPKTYADIQSATASFTGILPSHLHPCLNAQRRAILSALRNPEIRVDQDEDDSSTNMAVFQQLSDLLNGTVARGEGNSCLVLGPRGSGKTTLVEQAIAGLSDNPIVLRLSGWAQQNDRLALREIARQLSEQTGKSFLSDTDVDPQKVDEEENPFLDPGVTINLPPSSHLPSLVSMLPTLPRPTIVVLDSFDLFAAHPRQSLLYCLLDTAQSCRVGQGNKGIAVVGVTSRIDSINLLEKRVKSRFSGRMLRTAAPSLFEDWLALAKNFLSAPLEKKNAEWAPLWSTAVNSFIEDQTVLSTLRETFALTRDVRVLIRLLTAVIADLTPQSPFPIPSRLSHAIAIQRCRFDFPHLHTLSYPAICLLIAAMHAQTAGHDIFNFEMLHESFRDQMRASAAAPIQIEGGSIGMMRCSREVLTSSFEHLVAIRIFTNVAAPSINTAREFVRYRCAVEREDVKRAVDKIGQTNLKKWLNKA